MSCLEMPRSPAPDFLGEKERTLNDAKTMQPRAPSPIPADARNGARVKSEDVQPEGLYRPNYNVLTPNMRSPDYVQMSTAAAITLGVMGGYMHRTSCTHCLNLLLTYPEGCRPNCAYCGLARHREADRNYADRNFIRVDWPAVPYDHVIDIVASGGDGGRFHRMCISMITHPRSDPDTRVVLEKWVDRIKHVPVSILSNPTTMTRLDVQEPAHYRPRNDIEVDGRKISGTGGFFDSNLIFYQGTLLIDFDPAKMLACLNVPAEKLPKRAIDSAAQRIITMREVLGGTLPDLDIIY